MKQLFLLLLIATMIYGCDKTTSSTITLDIKNAGSGEFIALLPTDGYASLGALDTIRFEGDTVVQIPVTTAGGMVSISFWGQNLKSIKSVCGDGDFTIIYNPADSLMPIKYQGTNAVGRDMLQKQMNTRNIYKYQWVSDFTQYPLDTVGNKMAANFEAEMSENMVGFDSLLNFGTIDNTFYDYAKLDLDVYYATSMAKVILCNYSSLSEKNIPMYDGYVQELDNIYERLPVSLNTYGTNGGITHAQLYFSGYKQLKDFQKGIKPTTYNNQSEYMGEILTRIDTTVTDEKLKQAICAGTLFDWALNNKENDTIIVASLDKYIAAYPASRMNNYFEEHKNYLNTYYAELDRADMSQVNIIESDSVSTLNALIDRFEGKPLFIDFWFSTCGPCINEIKQSGELKQFLADNDIQMLYVSVDSPQAATNWLNNIKYYKMYGNHIRTSMPLHVDLNQSHGIYSFPTYMIVDEKGKILVPRAQNPSSGKLIEQIKDALKL